MMKNLIFPLFFLLASVTMQIDAQTSPVYLLPDFVQGTVLMKNGERTTAMLNYDATNQRMVFKQEHELLILTNAELVDTIYLDNRKFFPIKKLLFLECVPCENGTIYINWSLQSKYLGQKGAYGQVSHSANIETINTSYWTNHSYNRMSPDIHRIDNKNEYWLNLDGKFVNCKNKKTLLKLFPKHIAEIKEYMRKKKTNFSEVEQIVALLNYCIGLK